MFCRSLFVLILLVIVLSVLLRFTASDYPFWYLQTFLICLFVLFLLAIVLSVLLRFTASDYPFGIFKLSVANGLSDM